MKKIMQSKTGFAINQLQNLIFNGLALWIIYLWGNRFQRNSPFTQENIGEIPIQMTSDML
jgi:hypothetical protein